MTIEEREEAYRQLHEQLLHDELDEESFRAQVDRLSFQDVQGTPWKIGWYTGHWYRYLEGKWIRDRPTEHKVAVSKAENPAPTKLPAKHRSIAFWVTFVLIGLVALASVGLVLGWYARNADDLAELSGGTAGLSPAAGSTVLPSKVASGPTTSPAPTSTQPPSAPSTLPTKPAAETMVPPAIGTTSPTSLATPIADAGQDPSPTLAPPDRPAPSGAIFFPAYDRVRRSFDIYRFDLASGEKDLVVAQASQPALSPSGKRLAYRSWNSEYLGLRVLELPDGNTWTWINFAEAARPSWSPDSQNIIFPSKQEPDRQWRIYQSLGLEFNRVRRQGGDILGRVPAWLSDGRIVYWECPLSKCGLYAMHGDGTSPLRLTTYEHDTAPTGSPDGSQIAFMSDRDGNWEIYTAGTHLQSGQKPGRLTQNAARDGLPTWSPDGGWIAFVTDRDGSWAVWAVQPDGSGLQKLFDLGGSLEGEIAGVIAENQEGWTWESIAWEP